MCTGSGRGGERELVCVGVSVGVCGVRVGWAAVPSHTPSVNTHSQHREVSAVPVHRLGHAHPASTAPFILIFFFSSNFDPRCGFIRHRLSPCGSILPEGSTVLPPQVMHHMGVYNTVLPPHVASA